MPYDLFLIKKLLKSRICEIHKTVHDWLGQIIWLKEKKKKKRTWFSKCRRTNTEFKRAPNLLLKQKWILIIGKSSKTKVDTLNSVL